MIDVADVAQIEMYLRARGCTCLHPPVQPGSDHESGCRTLFRPLGLLDWLMRILLVLSGWAKRTASARVGMWWGRGNGFRGRRFARRIRRCAMGGGWLRRYVGGSLLPTRFLYSRGGYV